MAYFLFADESGHDWKATPYEVFCGLAIEDRALWPFIADFKTAEYESFGQPLNPPGKRLKGSQLLSRKVFRQAWAHDTIDPWDRRREANEALVNGATATTRQLAALAQAKLSLVNRMLDLCHSYGVRVFATYRTEPSDLTLSQPMLDKNYVYLFERFFYFLEEQYTPATGIVCYDEYSRSSSHLMVHQMENYFKKTEKGRERARLIVPEPFFVHNDLSIGNQIADVFAYLLNWGFRLPTMTQPVREELVGMAESIKPLRFRTVRMIPGLGKMEIWSVVAVR
jgi:hypothetical protein